MAEIINCEDSQIESEVSIQSTEVTPLLNSSSVNSRRIWSVRRHNIGTVCVTSKAALLTLFWSFCIGILYGLSSNPGILLFSILGVEFISLIYFLNAISLCFYPLAGYLADNVLGRYTVIIRSLRLLVTVTLAFLPLTLVISIFVTGESKSDTDHSVSWSDISLVGGIGMGTLSVLFYIVMNFSFVAFNANVIQFGMEQLLDSPIDHQSLYIYWYVWIFYNVQILILQPWTFLFFNFTTSMVLFGVLGGSPFIMIAVSLCVAHRNKKWFLINPARVNPYKLVNRITRFARHHKVPIRRSAFTYCEDEIPTGLDLAKTKYGGPYTTEEVENVKAFYGIIKILLSLGPVFFLTYASDSAFFWYSGNNYPHKMDNSNLSFQYNNNVRYNDEFVYQYFLGSNIVSSLVTTILIPVYIIIKQLDCCHTFSILKRIGLGIIFQILTLTSIVGLVSFITLNNNDCLLKNHSEIHVYFVRRNIHILSFLPFVIPHILYGIANLFLYTAMYEFICAQSPPSMKGLLIGLSFAIKGIFQAIGAAFIIPFSYIPTYILSCGMWYYGINVLVAVVTLVIFTYVARKYKYRQRDEICDVYRYAEEYYSSTQEQKYD